MWNGNEYIKNGKVVGEIWKRQPTEDGYKTFPWGYFYNRSIGYIASSEKEARKQVERHARY